MVPNATPHQLVSDIIQMNRSGEHWLLNEHSGEREVLEDINDHSAVLHQMYKFPSPLQDREGVQMYIWKEM